MDFTAQRQRLTHLLMRENGGQPLRVANGSPLDGTPNRWFETDGSPYYDYRVALDNEVVFDIDEKDWGIGREKAIFIEVILRQIGHDFWLAPSGKKGIHIHVFLDSVTLDGRVDRVGFAQRIIETARDMFAVDISTDPVGYAKGTQVFREFGTLGVGPKGPLWRKTLWTLPAHMLPDSREQAYAMAGVVIPVSVPHKAPYSEDLKRMVHDVTGYRCKTECDPQTRDFCENCPLFL